MTQPSPTTPVVAAGPFGDWLRRMRRSLQGDEGMDVPCGDCVGCCVSGYSVQLRPEDHRGRTFYMNVGCDACNHTGYRGRTAIHELLDLSDNIREMIVERRPGSEVRRAAEAEGLTSLRDSALQKVFSGISTLHEINRVTFVEELNATK